jgi:Cyclic nucleotide-binding domain/Popeye protein conserved region
MMHAVMGPTTWITVANALYIASYAVHDILWLRVLSVIAALLLIPYYYLQSTPLWTPIYWNLAFIAINGVWIFLLLLQRRPVHLSSDEKRLRDLSFGSLTPREASHLFKMGQWDDFEPGASIVQQDRTRDRFSVILSGVADVYLGGVKIGELGEGQFVGDIDSRAEKLPGLDVIVTTPVRVMCWSRRTLQEFLRKRSDVALALARSVDLQLRRLLDNALLRMRGTSA